MAHFLGLGGEGGSGCADPGSLEALNWTPWSPDLDFCRFLIDSGFPWDPLGGHFADFGIPYLQHGLRDGFFSGSGLEIMAGPDAWMCVKHSKY